MNQSGIRLFGIFGYPLKHTLSPAMQEAGFQAVAFKAYYLPFEFDLSQFKKTMRGLSHFALEGFNLTVPYKQTVIPYLDRLTPEARAVGACNTVFRRGKKWVGANTDVYGFTRTLREEGQFFPRGRNCVVLGAGGAARAAVYALASEGAAGIVIVNRRPERAKKIVSDFKSKFKTVFTATALAEKNLSYVFENADLIVNATSLGLKPGEMPLPSAGIVPSAKKAGKKLFFDLIYKPEKTEFLLAAEKHGHRILNGLGMLLHQGARAFELWTGKKAPVIVMRKALAKALENPKE